MAKPQSKKPSAGAKRIADLSGKLTIRKKVTRRRRLTRTLVLIAVASFVGFLVWLIGFSSVLTVKKVQVSGNQIDSREQILQVAGVEMEKPLAQVPTKQIAKRVGELPAVERVRVSRRWPNTLLIRITERQAVFQRVSGSEFQWIDREGVLFNTVTQATEGLIKVTTDSVDTRLLADVAKVVASFPSEWRDQVELVSAKSVDQITVQLTSNKSIFWGSADKSELKAKVVNAMLGIDATRLDVSSPENPTSQK